MKKLTRLEACKQIRSDSLYTSILHGEQPFKLELTLMEKYGNKYCIALFHKWNGISQYGIKVSVRQVLHFLRRYYPRFVK